MSTDPGQAQQVLRVALVTPLVYGVAVWMGAPLPFVAAMLFATFTLKMPVPPPFASRRRAGAAAGAAAARLRRHCRRAEPVPLPDGGVRRPGALPCLPAAGGAEDRARRRAAADLRHHAPDRHRRVRAGRRRALRGVRAQRRAGRRRPLPCLRAVSGASRCRPGGPSGARRATRWSGRATPPSRRW